jgi:glycosidase
MENLLVEAQSTDTKVFFDVVVNHTADTISYQGVSGGAPFVSVEKRPYTDASGAEIDLADWADDWALFPELDAATSFPYVPYRPSDTYLVPEQLNDLTWYHNRGEANLSNNDASSLSGDFAGLDDLMTERGELALLLADEMVIPWIQLGLAGIRIDTVKYVGLDFWTLFTERIATSAAAKETDSFFMFGEAYDADVPNVVSPPMRQTDMDSMLDFPFAFAVQDYVKGGNGSILRDMFERDDYYITAGTDPNDMVTFVSNHDMGRIATIIGASKPDLEQRVKLAYALEFLSRGQPVVYYGDEQGFVGTGGDKEARQTMFGPVDGSYEGSPYADDPLLGGGTLGSDYEPYDTSSGMYRYISELAALREAHPALASGAQVSLGDEGPVYAFARVLPDEKRENIVAVNSSSAEATIHLTTLTPDASYTAYYPADLDRVAKADSSGALTLTVPAYGAIVLGSNREVADAALSAADYTVTASAPFPAQGVDTAKSAKVMVQATAPANRWTQTSVYARVAGGEWIWQGTDTGPNPRVFVDVSNFPDGADLEFRAVTTNAHGDRVSASVGKSASLDHPEDYQGGSDTFPNWEFLGLLGGVFFGIIGLFIVVAIVGRKRRD